MIEKAIIDEIKKCTDNPYYFATKYITIVNDQTKETHPFTTFLKEDEFNYLIRTWNKK